MKQSTTHNSPDTPKMIEYGTGMKPACKRSIREDEHAAGFPIPLKKQIVKQIANKLYII